MRAVPSRLFLPLFSLLSPVQQHCSGWSGPKVPLARPTALIHLVSMMTLEFLNAHRLCRVVALGAGLLMAETALSITDPTLQVSLTRAGQSSMVTWAGTVAVPYQVEASSDLTVWTNASSVMTGTGAQLSFTNSTPGQDGAFLRVKRYFPPRRARPPSIPPRVC